MALLHVNSKLERHLEPPQFIKTESKVLNPATTGVINSRLILMQGTESLSQNGPGANHSGIAALFWRNNFPAFINPSFYTIRAGLSLQRMRSIGQQIKC